MPRGLTRCQCLERHLRAACNEVTQYTAAYRMRHRILDADQNTAAAHHMWRPHIVCGHRIQCVVPAYCMRYRHIIFGDRIRDAVAAYCMRLPHTMIFAVFCIQGPEECARVRELRDLIAQESKLHAYLTAPIHVHPLHCAPPCSQLYSSTCH